MAKTAIIHARTEPYLKAEVENILKKLGLNTTEAINLYFSQIRLRRGLPFEVRIPNKISLKTFQKTDERKELKEYKSMDEFIKKMAG